LQRHTHTNVRKERSKNKLISFTSFSTHAFSLSFSTTEQMVGGGILSRFWMDAEFKKWAEGQVLERIREQPRSWTELFVLLVFAFIVLRFAFRQFAVFFEMLALMRESKAARRHEAEEEEEEETDALEPPSGGENELELEEEEKKEK
jgi:hypothetical protein